MNRLFRTLRNFAEKNRPAEAPADSAEEQEALPGFDDRLAVLATYAERASGYEDELTSNYELIVDNLAQLQGLMEMALDEGRDRDALEYLRLGARLRPQRELIEQEMRAFGVVAEDLLRRVKTLIDHMDEARAFAQSAEENPAATYYLDQTITTLTRYFVLLERVTLARHKSLPQRLAEKMLLVVDDRELDLELARFILSRRRALGPSSGSGQ